jgi:ribosome-interacting GTPase 1
LDTCVNVYVGTEETLEDFFYIDLVVNGKSFQIHKSVNCLNDITEEDFLQELGDILNVLVLFQKEGHFKISVDGEMIVNCADEISEKCTKISTKLLEEFNK